METTTFYRRLHLTYDTKRSIEDYQPKENFRDTPFFNLEPAALHYGEDFLNYQQELEKGEEVDVTENTSETNNPTEDQTSENGNKISKPSYSNLPQKLFDLLELIKHFNLSSNSELLLDLHKLYNKYNENTTTTLIPIELENDTSEYSEYDDEVEFRKDMGKKSLQSSQTEKSMKEPEKKKNESTSEKRKPEKKQPKGPPENSEKKRQEKPSKESEQKENLSNKDKKQRMEPSKPEKCEGNISYINYLNTYSVFLNLGTKLCKCI